MAGFTNFPNGITSMGVPVPGTVPSTGGTYWFVDVENGADGNSGKSLQQAFETIDRALDFIQPNDCVLIAPGEYDEAITLARSLGANFTFMGLGGRGAVYIAPSTTNAVAVTNHCDDVTFINVGLDGDGTGAGLINTGSRLRLYGCKIEGDDVGAQLTLGTVATEAAGTAGVGADVLVSDCEFAWTAQGLLLTCTDYGAVTQVFVDRCRFHNHSAAAIDESVGSGGSAAILFQNLEISNCVFDDLDDGTAPTAFILLNDDNANNGIVTQCAFPSAINSGKNLVSTALHWVCNYHTGGVSTGQPS